MQSKFQTLLGVVSWGNKCATEKYPGVNVGVSYFVEWIEDIMEKNTPTNNQSNRKLASLSYFSWMMFLVSSMFLRKIPDFL